MDKKTIGIVMAAILAGLSGGAEVLSLGERVEALEKIHPELDAPEAPSEEEEPEEAAQEPESPEPTEEPDEEPESAPEPAEDEGEPEAEAVEE